MATAADNLHPFSGVDLRRSTRIERAVPLIVSGQNRLGQQFQERTSAVSLNLHGCRYRSRHDYRIGTWVTLQVAEPGSETKSPVIRAMVRSIHTPLSPRDLYHIGVELETPANVWGVPAPPDDWIHPRGEKGTVMQFGTAVAPAREPAPKLVVPPQAAPHLRNAEVAPAPASAEVSPPPAVKADAAAESAPPKPRLVITPEMLVTALQGKLQQAAEKAVHTALSVHVNEAVRKAVSTIDDVSRTSVRQVEESATRRLDALVRSAREEIARQLDARLAEFHTGPSAQLEPDHSQVEEALAQLEKIAVDARRDLEETRKAVERIVREVEPQIRMRLEDSVRRATEEFEGSAAQVSDRQLVRLMEESQAITRETSSQVEARAAEVRSLLQGAASVTLDEFRRQAAVQADLTISETKQRVESSLASLDAENRAACEARRRTLESDVARAAEQSTEQFRKAIKAFLYSCLVAAVSAVDEHTQSTLDGLIKNDGSVLPEVGKSAGSGGHAESVEHRTDLLPH